MNANRVVFEKNGCKINCREELIATADLINKVYKLNVSAPGPVQHLAAATSATGKTWHHQQQKPNQDEKWSCQWAEM